MPVDEAVEEDFEDPEEAEAEEVPASEEEPVIDVVVVDEPAEQA